MAKDHKLKTRTRYTATYNTELFNKLKQHSEETEVPFSKLLDRCIKMYLESKNLIDKDKE